MIILSVVILVLVIVLVILAFRVPSLLGKTRKSPSGSYNEPLPEVKDPQKDPQPPGEEASDEYRRS